MISKKLAVLVGVSVFVVAGFVAYAFFPKSGGATGILSPFSNYQPPKANGNSAAQAQIAAEPKTEPCPLNGELLTKTQKQLWESRRPLGIMVENHVQARPQSGLSSADIIYEAVAEGGITRFLSIFYCKDAPYVGPVRSARMYFIKLLEGYGNYPLYAHVGGANTPGPADALGYINTLGWGLYNDMNQFAIPFPYYWRDYERLPNRATEHTVYTATAKLWQYAKDNRGLTNVDDKGVAWNKGFTPWQFQDDAAPADRGMITKISFGFWSSFASDYAVTWNYDRSTNSYSRVNGGQPHIDKDTGKPITSKNIMVVFAQESPVNDGYDAGQHILYAIVGSGDAFVFQNGNAIHATWSKPDETSTMEFTDNKTGKQIKMVRGQDFIEILPIGNKVTY